MLKTETFTIGLSVSKLMPTSINENNTGQIYNQHYHLFDVFTNNFNECVMLKPAVILEATQAASLFADAIINFVFDQSYTFEVLTHNQNRIGLLDQAKSK